MLDDNSNNEDDSKSEVSPLFRWLFRYPADLARAVRYLDEDNDERDNVGDGEDRGVETQVFLVGLKEANADDAEVDYESPNDK